MPTKSRTYRSLRDALRGDVGCAIAAAAGGAIAFAPIEYVLTLATYAGAIGLVAKLKLAALTATLAIWLWLLLAIGLSAAVLMIRVAQAQLGQPHGPGWLRAPGAIKRGEIRPGAPRLWATVAAGLISIAAIQRFAAWAIGHFREPELTAALIAIAAVIWLAIAAALYRALLAVARAAAAGLAPLLGVANPLGRWRAAGLALAGMIAGVLLATWLALPQSRSVLPIRLVISAVVVGLGMGIAAMRHVRPGPRRARTRRDALAFAGGALVLMVTTLVWLGADLEAKYVAITASPALDKLISVVRFANDLDRDGFGSLLGEGDCAPLDRAIHPGAIDIPDNGIDENCDGHDFSLRDVAAIPGAGKQVPPRFQQDWNVLLITIDALRYDHTTFGGYADGPKHRDTTPNLAALANRAVSFTFANAPSAGTMASIPAILTSKYFHSGIALGDERPGGQPPLILPENTTLPEIMKRKGYATAVVASHVYWNNWGLDQGVDDYDNSIAKTDDPFRVAADKVTDHVLAWVSRQQGKRWFMWAHYIDPHGRYVAHPDVVDYGSSEPDLYDAEIKWTDQEIGRLLRELARLPSDSHTIIVITSDHGDSMAEHSVPLGTHGTALYRELQHVPLIIYVPDNKPRRIGGAVSNLDIVPTLAALCGIDIHDLQLEGRSLVPQLFYDGTEDHDRIVFAETNAPQKQRAAISERWKLIYYFANNVYELFDLKADPWEHTNLAAQGPPALATMKQALQGWLDRVMYARDPTFNQAYRQIADVMLASPPAPKVTTADQTLDGIDILGFDIDGDKPVAPGARIDLHIYFHVREATETPYQFLASAWSIAPGTEATTAPDPAHVARTNLRATALGGFATDRWKAGDYIRERFTLTIPGDWRGDRVGFGLTASGPSGKHKATGQALANDPFTMVLGTLTVGSSAAQAP